MEKRRLFRISKKDYKKNLSELYENPIINYRKKASKKNEIYYDNYLYQKITKLSFILFFSILYFLSMYIIKHKTPLTRVQDDITRVQDDITLVTTLFQIPTPRHSFSDYLTWVENLLQINRSIVFFIQKNISEIIKRKRPKIYENKTIWIEQEFSELYFNKYKKEFEQTYLIDGFQYKHNVHLFIIWNEKLKFLERAINANYFNSEYFFWIDAGLFREDFYPKYISNWPSIKKLKEDPRVFINEVETYPKEYFEKLIAFDSETHEKYKNSRNTAGDIYGGRADYFIKFINYYYDIFLLWMKNGKFIGSDQNLYSVIGYLHPEVLKKVNLKDFPGLRDYFRD